MEQKSKQIKDLSDLELAEASGQLYQQLMMVQQNLIAINEEIKKRKEKIKGVKEEDAKK
jgi:hypothetical protein